MILKSLSLFSGVGGLDMGCDSTGRFETVAFCEIDPNPRAVLARHWPHVRQFSDVRYLNKRALDHFGLRIDAIFAGFPCQDLSYAGKGAGIEGARSGLWAEVARLIRRLRPVIVILENVPAILSRGLGRVCGDLAQIGYDCFWDCIPAGDLGAPHKRDRWFCVAYPQRARRQGFKPHDGISGSESQAFAKYIHEAANRWAALDQSVASLRDCDGVSVGVERRRIKMMGNAVCPPWAFLIAKTALAALDAMIEQSIGVTE
jgi:DNA (cytosine-5)-methyltransferase 1